MVSALYNLYISAFLESLLCVNAELIEMVQNWSKWYRIDRNGTAEDSKDLEIRTLILKL